MKKIIAILLAVAGWQLSVVAAPVTPQQAASVARTFWSQALQGKDASQLVDRTAEWPYSAVYLFTHPAGGFVLVAADDAARPILGYSVTSTMDPARRPIQLQEWLQGYQDHIEWLGENDGQPYAADADAWAMLLKGDCPSGAGTKSVAPLLTTQWDQDYPYNMLCPGTTVTGCAATAQAQLMKFWNYPAFGMGSHSYTHATYGEQSADFGHTLYDWEHMPNQMGYWSSAQECQAVGTLMYHCGVSLEMNYGTTAQGGSAALGLADIDGYFTINNALKNYFGYSQNMQVEYKDAGYFGNGYTNDQWRAMLIAELDLGHPVLYTGSATQGGHGFVCDGYDNRQYLHFNFGWSGVGDGYYPVDSISPGVGGAGGNGTYTFNMNNAALFGAVPDYRIRLSDTLYNFDGEAATDSVLFGINEAVNTTWSVSSNASWLTVDNAAFSRAGWVCFHVAESNESGERIGTLTFTQGNETLKVRVIQVNYNTDDLCPLTVVMESTHGSGWQGGAYLSLESANGYVFGTASLQSGQRDSVVINVSDHDIYSVWHSGGGTDRYINYYVKNQYGETVVEAEYAYSTGGTDLLVWPCAHLGVRDVQASDFRIYPNPASVRLHIDAEGLQQVEIVDMTGRTIGTYRNADIDIRPLPAGAYFVRVTTADSTGVKRLVVRK